MFFGQLEVLAASLILIYTLIYKILKNIDLSLKNGLESTPTLEGILCHDIQVAHFITICIVF